MCKCLLYWRFCCFGFGLLNLRRLLNFIKIYRPTLIFCGCWWIWFICLIVYHGTSCTPWTNPISIGHLIGYRIPTFRSLSLSWCRFWLLIDITTSGHSCCSWLMLILIWSNLLLWLVVMSWLWLSIITGWILIHPLEFIKLIKSMICVHKFLLLLLNPLSFLFLFHLTFFLFFLLFNFP